MKPTEPLLPSDWQVGVKVWAERAGRAIFGEGRLDLLEAIDQQHSISAAARHMGMSYRHAWLMVQSMNEAAGEPLVLSATGGQHGGGARLTTLGRWAVLAFREMNGQLRQTAAALLRRGTGGSAAGGIHVAAAVCLEEALGQALTDFALEHPEVRVRAVYGASDELADHVLAGAPVDLFLSAGPEPLDLLERAGLTDARSRRVLAQNFLAAVGAPGADLPIRSAADLVRPEVSRLALADVTCPLGRYTRAYLTGLGLFEQLSAKAIYVDNSRAVGAAVRSGSAEVGLVYGSEATQAPGCRLLFKARKGPPPIQLCGAVVRQGLQETLARLLLAYLGSRPAARRFRQCGFLPVA